MNSYQRTVSHITDIQAAIPHHQMIPEEAVCELLDRLKATHIPMHALLIMRHGKLVTEGYYAPFSAHRLHRMFSICKSLNALAIGLLEYQGRLSLQDPVCKYFPDKLPEHVHPFIASMTIENLLMMRTCHASTTYKSAKGLEWVESFFKTPPSHKPGTIFHYDTSAAHVLCMLSERVSGQPMLDFLKDHVLREIGWSEESYILENEFGDPQGGSGLMCTARDLLLLGQLLLQKGCWNGHRLLPEKYIEKATACLTPTVMTGPVLSEMQGYGYQIWRGERNNFVLYGMGGQLAICFPDYDMVCVTCADTQGMAGANQSIYNSIYETLLPAIDAYEAGCYPVPPMEGGYTAYDRLQNKLQALQITSVSELPFALSTPPDCRLRIQGRTFRIADNPHGYTACKLFFDPNGLAGRFHYTYQGHTCTLHFGTDKPVTGILDVHDLFYGASGTWIADNTFLLKCHILDTSVGSISMEFVFGEDDVTIFMKKVEETYLNEYNCHLYGV